jgi:hypothetical protein
MEGIQSFEKRRTDARVAAVFPETSKTSNMIGLATRKIRFPNFVVVGSEVRSDQAA